MNHLNVLLVDDERSARELLKDLLKEESWIDIVGEAANVDEALKQYQKLKPQVILLDIQMPVRDGFELVEELQKKDASVYIIFITAFEKYAIKAIKASAIDYLLKPVKKSELLDSMEKAMEKVKDSGMTNRYSKLLKQLSSQKRLLFRNRTGFSVFDADEIIYCQADSNYSVLKLDSGRDHLVSMNLGKVEQLLPADTFCRISRSLVVNINYLKEVDRKSMKCILDGSSPVQLDISKKYLKLLEQACESGFNLKDL